VIADVVVLDQAVDAKCTGIELKFPNRATLASHEHNLSWNVNRWCGYGYEV